MGWVELLAAQAVIEMGPYQVDSSTLYLGVGWTIDKGNLVRYISSDEGAAIAWSLRPENQANGAVYMYGFRGVLAQGLTSPALPGGGGGGPKRLPSPPASEGLPSWPKGKAVPYPPGTGGGTYRSIRACYELGFNDAKTGAGILLNDAAATRQAGINDLASVGPQSTAYLRGYDDAAQYANANDGWNAWKSPTPTKPTPRKSAPPRGNPLNPSTAMDW